MPALAVDNYFVPPFPDDVPTAPLLEISLHKLLHNDAREQERLWDAATKLGFFYLDVRGPSLSDLQSGAAQAERHPEVDGILADVEELFHVAKELFDEPLEEKQKYDYAKNNSYFGYKGYGGAVIDAQGTKDRNEFYNISKDAILRLESNPLPSIPVLDKYHKVVESYIKKSHHIATKIILPILNAQLGLPKGTLEELHGINKISGDQVRFVKAPPQPEDDSRTALGAHTDFGSVTVLFAKVGGLQVLLPPSTSSQSNSIENQADSEGTWAYVAPMPGRAVINLGDALVKFSAGVLRSNIHRVVAPPGSHKDLTKYSLVYFCRPQDDIVLKSLPDSAVIKKRVDSGVWKEDEDPTTSKEWILRRALGRRGMGGGFKTAGGTEGQGGK